MEFSLLDSWLNDYVFGLGPEQVRIIDIYESIGMVRFAYMNGTISLIRRDELIKKLYKKLDDVIQFADEMIKEKENEKKST